MCTYQGLLIILGISISSPVPKTYLFIYLFIFYLFYLFVTNTMAAGSYPAALTRAKETHTKRRNKTY